LKLNSQGSKNNESYLLSCGEFLTSKVAVCIKNTFSNCPSTVIEKMHGFTATLVLGLPIFK
jgi:hypothetical protein